MTSDSTKLKNTFTYKGNIYSGNEINDIQALLDIKNPAIGDIYSIGNNDEHEMWNKNEIYVYTGTDWVIFNRCYAPVVDVLRMKKQEDMIEKMKKQEDMIENITKIQDDFLIELNQLAGIPDLTFYKNNRQCVYVDEAIMECMEKLAYDYQEFIISVREKTIHKNRVYNERWLFDVIEKYYKVQR